MIASSGCVGAGIRRPDSYTVFHNITGKINKSGSLTTSRTENSTNKFIGTSLYGASGYVYTTLSPEITLKQKFTIDGWLNIASIATNGVIFELDFTGGITYMMLQRYSSNNAIGVAFSDGWLITNGDFPPTSSWVFLEVNRDADYKIRIFINGTLSGNPEDKTITPSINGVYFVGGVNGYSSQLRFLNGICNHPSNSSYTPPTRRF